MSSSFTWDVKKKMEKLSNLRKIISFIFTQGDKATKINIKEMPRYATLRRNFGLSSVWSVQLVTFPSLIWLLYFIRSRFCPSKCSRHCCCCLLSKICIECATWKNSRHIVGICFFVFFTFLMFILFFLYKLCDMKTNIWRHKNKKLSNLIKFFIRKLFSINLIGIFSTF